MSSSMTQMNDNIERNDCKDEAFATAIDEDDEATAMTTDGQNVDDERADDDDATSYLKVCLILSRLWLK